jgi:hypothetical protein
MTGVLIKREESQVHWLTPVIPANQGVANGRIKVQGQPRQNSIKTPIPPILTNKPGAVVHNCDPSYKGGEWRSEADPRQIFKILTEK